MNKEISLAPMLDITTANFRRFVRLTSQTVVLFTEMIVANTVTHISTDKLREKLGNIDDKTIVQVGGSDPAEIASAVSILKTHGCKHFNLNVGCPSARVQKGAFGAVLMKDKSLVCDIVNTVYDICGIVLSLKIRIGVDEYDSYDFFRNFVNFLIKNSPVTKFYVHSRKCWLNGLSPKQNRNVPPLNYSYVYKIKEENPRIEFVLNGGLKGPNDYEKIETLDGMMIGREAMNNILVFRNFEEYNKMQVDSVSSIVFTYLSEYGIDMPVKYNVLMPLQNLLYKKRGSKLLRVAVNDATKQKMTYRQFYNKIESLIN